MMNPLMLFIWAAVIIVMAMGLSKYRFTRPPVLWMVAFFVGGLLSVWPAAVVNGMINAETRFGFHSPNPLDSSIFFIIGPGMGEEFFKFSFGLAVTMAAIVLRAPLTPASRMQGFVMVALGFAVLENAFYFQQGLTARGMIIRGLLPVPMHACMGFIHGAMANRSIRTRRGWPILAGYITTMSLHASYNILASRVHVAIPAGMILVLVAVCTVLWLLAPEANPSEDEQQQALDDEWVNRPLDEDY